MKQEIICMTCGEPVESWSHEYSRQHKEGLLELDRRIARYQAAIEGGSCPWCEGAKIPDCSDERHAGAREFVMRLGSASRLQ
jgi:hypothetical protein